MCLLTFSAKFGQFPVAKLAKIAEKAVFELRACTGYNFGTEGHRDLGYRLKRRVLMCRCAQRAYIKRGATAYVSRINELGGASSGIQY